MKKRKIIIALILLPAFLLHAQVRQAEYFFDADPGYGNATIVSSEFIAEDGPDRLYETVSFNAPVSELEDGCHTLYVRAKNENGWSQTQSRPFIKMTLSNETACEVQYAEYFFDNDPGLGSATSITLPESGDSYIFDVDIKSMSNGLHTLYVRALNKDNRWSMTMSRPFVKTILPTDLASGLTAVEYYIDTDPGEGKAIVAPFSEDENSLDFIVDLTNISLGNHTLYLRGKNRIDQWENIGEHLFTVIEGSGINDLADSGIYAYPNPVQNILFIKNEKGNVTAVELTDINGKVLCSQSVEPGTAVVQLSLVEYPSGQYLLKIKHADGFKTVKILKR